MADVAREAGVALGTVSRVVNGQQVGEEFRIKVEEAIRKIGYQYNSSGQHQHHCVHHSQYHQPLFRAAGSPRQQSAGKTELQNAALLFGI